MNKQLVAELLGYVFKLKFVAGYRTYIAAAGLLGAAIYRAATGDYTQAVSDAGIALGILGIGEKVNDTTGAEPTDPTPSTS